MNTTALLATLLLLTPAARGQTADERSLAERDPAWNALRQSGDADALAALMDDRFVLTHSDGKVQYKQDYLDELRTRKRVNQGIVNEDVMVRTYGDTGVVTGTSVQSAVSNGQSWSGRFRFTRTWVRRDGRWILVSSHSSRGKPMNFTRGSRSASRSLPVTAPARPFLPWNP